VPTAEPAEELPLADSADVVRARHRVRDRAIALGFDLVGQTRIVTATSELARNTHLHGGGGTLTISTVDNGRSRGLRLTFIDSGPGIADVDKALVDGWSSKGGLGLGLGGTRRLVDEFAIESGPGRGTRVEIVQWLTRR
jgi:serine/threonine-protein kinase RsbT